MFVRQHSTLEIALQFHLPLTHQFPKRFLVMLLRHVPADSLTARLIGVRIREVSLNRTGTLEYPRYVRCGQPVYQALVLSNHLYPLYVC